MTFGEKLQLLRKQKGLSQEQLAVQLTVSRQSVSKWELDSSLPDTENIIQLSAIFNVSLDYLLKDNFEQNSDALLTVAVPTKKVQNKLAPKIMMIIGGMGVILFWVLSSIFPAVISYAEASAKGEVSNEVVQYGLPAFLKMHNMELLFLLCCVTFIIGLVLFCYFVIKVKIKSAK